LDFYAGVLMDGESVEPIEKKPEEKAKPVKKSKRKLLLFLAVSVAVIAIAAGAIFFLQQPPVDGDEPIETPEDEFELSFRFIEGTALINERTEFGVEDGREVPRVVMRLLDIPREVGEDFTELESVMLSAFELRDGSRIDHCSEIHSTQKRGSYDIYPDGTIDRGTHSQTNFYLPSRKVKIGEKWKFENITYELKEKTTLTNSAGTFNVVKIGHYGTKDSTDQSGTTYFDYENGRIVETTLIGLSSGKVKKVKAELVGLIENFTDEDIDKTCLLAETRLTPSQQLQEAIILQGEGKFDDSLSVALKLRDELESTDLNREGGVLLAGAYLVMGDDYNALGKTGEAIESYFTSGEKFNENMFLTVEFETALAAYGSVLSMGDSDYYAQAETALQGLNDANNGEIWGRIIRKDNADSTANFSYLFNGFDAMGDRAEFKGRTNSIVLDSDFGTKLALIYYRDEYKPKFLPIDFDENALLEWWDAVLERMDDANKGTIAGVCYSAFDSPGNYGISSFEDMTVNIKQGTLGWQADCVNGFYRIELEPGLYSLEETGSEIEVMPAKAVIENVRVE